MFSIHYRLTQVFLVCILLISLIQTYRINEFENDKLAQPVNVARQHALEQILSRRSLYDPAFSDSWSNYFERKRRLFDPAYGDWANSFKRSDE